MTHITFLSIKFFNLIATDSYFLIFHCFITSFSSPITLMSWNWFKFLFLDGIGLQVCISHLPSVFIFSFFHRYHVDFFLVTAYLWRESFLLVPASCWRRAGKHTAWFWPIVYKHILTNILPWRYDWTRSGDLPGLEESS